MAWVTTFIALWEMLLLSSKPKPLRSSMGIRNTCVTVEDARTGFLFHWQPPGCGRSSGGRGRGRRRTWLAAARWRRRTGRRRQGCLRPRWPERPRRTRAWRQCRRSCCAQRRRLLGLWCCPYSRRVDADRDLDSPQVRNPGDPTRGALG